MEATSPLPLGSRTSAAVCPPPLPIITHTLLCPQAAELVAENGEAYEAHMRGVRDYLEERLAVSAHVAPGAWTSRGCGGRPKHTRDKTLDAPVKIQVCSESFSSN